MGEKGKATLHEEKRGGMGGDWRLIVCCLPVTIWLTELAWIIFNQRYGMTGDIIYTLTPTPSPIFIALADCHVCRLSLPLISYSSSFCCLLIASSCAKMETQYNILSVFSTIYTTAVNLPVIISRPPSPH